MGLNKVPLSLLIYMTKVDVSPFFFFSITKKTGCLGAGMRFKVNREKWAHPQGAKLLIII